MTRCEVPTAAPIQAESAKYEIVRAHVAIPVVLVLHPLLDITGHVVEPEWVRF